MSEELDEFFDRLASKQVGKELERAEEALSPAIKANVNSLWQTIKSKGEDFDERDLLLYDNMGVSISPELAIIGGLMQGIALPLLATSEVRTESLGELGVCLFAGTQLVFFRDAGDGVVYGPPNGTEMAEKLANCSRFAMVFHTAMMKACAWSGCHATLDNEGTFEWDGAWVGAPMKTTLDQWIRLTFQQSKMTRSKEKLESMEFAWAMRQEMEK